MRLFIAVELPTTIRQELAGCIKLLSSSVADMRWVETPNLHVTLKFLGSVAEAKLPGIKSELEKIARRSKPFVARLSSLGGFPRAAEPQIVWAGIGEGREDFEELAKLLDESMKEQGFQTDGQPFTAHVTLGRVRSKKNSEKISQAIREQAFVSRHAFEVTQITLFKSIASPLGPIYRVVERFSIFKRICAGFYRGSN